jgi:hypothetical protein
MHDGAERRAVALQEAVKIHTLQFGAKMAVYIDEDREMPPAEEQVDDILRLAERFDSFLYNGELGIKPKDDED